MTNIMQETAKHTPCMFRCSGTKGCGKVFRAPVTAYGQNFIRPEGIPHAGESDARPFAQCSCGRWLIGRPIVGKYNPEVACDGRCMGATGPNCECSCGGTNHGVSHA